MNVVPIRSTTQAFTEIEYIDRDIVLFSDGSCALVIATSAVNFGLLSQKEQEALIYAYAGFLNSLSFSIQLLIHTEHKDVTQYLHLLEEREKKQANPNLSNRIKSYRGFVSSVVKERDVLDKKFYIIIPFSHLEIGPSPKVLFGSKRTGLPYAKEYIIDKALTVLVPKRDHIVRLLNRLGLKAAQLSTEQLARLFFTIYNPTSPLPVLNSVKQTVMQNKTK